MINLFSGGKSLMTFDNCFEVRPKEMGFLEFALIQYLHKAQKSPKN